MSRETVCRSCRSERLEPILSLGETPLANRLLTREQLQSPEPRYPLELVFCAQCTLLQITETVDPEELFSDYVYFSSYSDLVVANAKQNASRILETRKLAPSDLVVEIASNDGYLLQHYQAAGIRVLGIEPARNIATEANRRGIETITEFFGLALAAQLRARGVEAAVIHANNVLAHVADLNGFVAGIAEILRADGAAVIEVPWVVEMIERCEFDTVYHEHLCYFSLTALQELFARHGLRVLDAEPIELHGGSLRFTVGRADAPSSRVLELLAREEAWGVRDANAYRALPRNIERVRESLLELLRSLKRDGGTLAAYGASAKGATLLNYFGIGGDLLEFVVDRSPVKQGKFTPGTHLPILAPSVLAERRPDYLLLLTWNHAAEILEQQRPYREQGGRFIIPIPEPAIVE
ncbi:MAG TPA: class I SAM-dependent methyltransferase [Thermoanaerobaculia bacterium]|nr:class I SAM-dependent methyltransferase [Thermoanaerobaculia bacterium]